MSLIKMKASSEAPLLQVHFERGRNTPCQQSMPWVWATILIRLSIAQWKFFTAVYHNEPIFLPDELTTVTLVIILVATALSLTSALYIPYPVLRSIEHPIISL